MSGHSALLNCWRDAYIHGNTLMYLPREIRDLIYHHYMCMEKDHACRSIMEGIWTGRKGHPLPALCNTNHQMRVECMRAFIRTKQFSLTQDPIGRSERTLRRLWGFQVDVTYNWIQNSIPDGSAFHNVRYLHVSESVLFAQNVTPWSREVGTSAMRLAQVLPNLTHLSLGFADVGNLRNTSWYQGKPVERYAHDTGLDQVLIFPKLKKLVLEVRRLEAFPYWHTDPFAPLESCTNFWTLVDWFNAEYRKRGQNVEVKVSRRELRDLMQIWLQESTP